MERRQELKKGILVFLTLAFTLAVVLPALAEDPAAIAAQNEKAETKTLRKEIVKLKYVRAQDVKDVLYTFLSPDGRIQFSSNMPTVLAVSDTPENIEKILAAIREIDVKPADVLFTVQLVLGSEADAQTDAELQNDPVVKELRKLLRYKGYTLLDSTLVRVINRERASVILGPKGEFVFALQPNVAGDAKAPVIKTEVRLRQITQQNAPESKEGTAQAVPNVTTLIESTLNIKSGDRTVVGVSKLDGGGKGLILIISGKIVD
jgi:type II secretory pathway component GspD/PulD (secretin)